jgi:hypothetical protein
MPLDYSSVDYSIPQQDGPMEYEFPYAEFGDLVSVIARQKYQQLWDNYAPPTQSSTITIGAVTAYLTKDDIPQDIGAGLCSFTREWRSIPAARSVPAGTYAYGFPGLPVGTLGSPSTITAMSPTEADVGTISAPVFTVAGHAFTVGQLLRVSVTWTSLTRINTVRVIAITTNTFTTTSFFIFWGTGDYGTFSTGTATPFQTGREPKTLITDTIDSFSYALPGVTSGITIAGDFRPDPLFAPFITSTGEETDTLSSLTTPTDSAYRTLVASGEYVAIESSIVLLAGQILERKTKLGRAM